MKFKLYFIASTLLLFTSILRAQINVGDWRDHFSFNNTASISETKESILCSSELGLFTVDKQTQELNKFTKLNGLSESEIQFARYNEYNQTLIIVYKNSNLDILKNGRIYNFPDIKIKQISAEKTINNITFSNESAYLSCGFGIVIFNTEKMEFGDTWIIGDNASQIRVNDFTFDENFFYAATIKGLIKCSKQNPALYSNWEKVLELPNPEYPVLKISRFGNSLFLAQSQPAGDTKTFCLKESLWTEISVGQYAFRQFRAKGDSIMFVDKKSIKIFKNDQSVISIDKYIFEDTTITDLQINDALYSKEMGLCIADAKLGLVIYDLNSDFFRKISPNGPITNTFGQSAFSRGKLYFTAGGFNGPLAENYSNPVYSIFDNFQTLSVPVPNCTHDAYSVLPHPYRPETMFIGAWGQGIYELENGRLKNHYTETNSSLQLILGLAGYIRIASLMMDKKQNLWATNPAATKPISVRTSDDIWHAFNFNGIINGKETGQLLNTASGDIWVQIFRGGGLFAFNPRNTYDTDTDDSYNLFSPKLASGETITSTVNCLAQDKNNDIWVGTDKGIAVYRNPENVFSNDNFYAEQIQLTSFAGDTTEQYLLNTENVTSIAIDGANRKWIGTENAGIFLVSEDGKKELLRFTTENSILPSNNIKDIDIDPTSGEVFIGSDKGLVSYRADAIEGKTSYDHVYAFPNPVCSDFAGVITITGLMTDSNVKITDLSGQLVFETTSKGGQATWNGCNFNGQKAATGVYLVWCALADGSSKVVTKIAFIN